MGATHPSGSAPGHGVVLIVEDDADVRESLREGLAIEGFEACTAGDGREALDFLRRNPAPCLILLDLWMPNMSGEQFRAEQLRDQALAEIPVVVISALSDAAARSSAMRARGFLPKPIDLDALLGVVRANC